jgi:preprotein translocase subunit SecE
MAADAVETAQGNWIVRKSRGLVSWYNDIVSEMRKVTWPDRTQLKDTTIRIILFVLFIGAVIGIIDVILQAILVRGIPSLFAGH